MYTQRSQTSKQRWRTNMSHTQTITFTGLQDHGADGVALALQEIWAVFDAQVEGSAARAVLDGVKTSITDGTMTVERNYDNSAGTLTITRTWDDDAWTAHGNNPVDTSAMTTALSNAGITVTGL